jgi:hypothetical protein
VKRRKMLKMCKLNNSQSGIRQTNWIQKGHTLPPVLLAQSK